MALRRIRRVLLIMKAESYRARDFLEAAAKLEIDLVVGSDRANVLADYGHRRTLKLDFNDIEDGVREITGFHLDRPLDAIVAVEDEGTVLAARASARLGLASNPEESVVAAENKAMMREILAAGGMQGPWFRRISLTDDPERAAGEVQYPCVLKPLYLSGSRGVIRADDEAGFVEAFHRISELLDDPEMKARGGAMAGQVLVEAYMPGREVAIEGILRNGELHLLAFFDKPDPMEGPFFEETIFVTPSRLPPEVQAEALAMANESVRALGLRSGPVHVELRIDGDQPSLLEVAPRTIGGHCSRVLSFGAGMSLEELVLRQALGIAPDKIQAQRMAAGVMMIPIPKAGTLVEVQGLEEAGAIDGIAEVEISIPLTQQVVPLPEGNRYLGFIFARGESPAFVENALRKAHGLLRFMID